MAATFEKVRLMALSMDNVGLRRFLQTCASRTLQKKEVAHLVRHQRSKNDPGWGVAAIAPSHLHIVSSIAVIYARCPLPVCSKLHNFEISRGHFRRSTLRGTRREKPGSPSLELAS